MAGLASLSGFADKITGLANGDFLTQVRDLMAAAPVLAVAGGGGDTYFTLSNVNFGQMTQREFATAFRQALRENVSEWNRKGNNK